MRRRKAVQWVSRGNLPCRGFARGCAVRGASWPRDMSAHEHEALVREFTIVRAHICGIPMGSYGTPGHRDLAQKALHLTKMERALCEDKPGFAPVEYVDVILAYWTT